MTAAAKTDTPQPVSASGQAPRPGAALAASDLAANLRRVARAVEAVYADGYREPGEIAADDAGASRLAGDLKPPSIDASRD